MSICNDSPHAVKSRFCVGRSCSCVLLQHFFVDDSTSPCNDNRDAIIAALAFRGSVVLQENNVGSNPASGRVAVRTGGCYRHEDPEMTAYRFYSSDILWRRPIVQKCSSYTKGAKNENARSNCLDRRIGQKCLKHRQHLKNITPFPKSRRSGAWAKPKCDSFSAWSPACCVARRYARFVRGKAITRPGVFPCEFRRVFFCAFTRAFPDRRMTEGFPKCKVAVACFSRRCVPLTNGA